MSILKPKIKLPDADKLIEMTLESQQITAEEERKAEELADRLNLMNNKQTTFQFKKERSQFNAYLN